MTDDLRITRVPFLIPAWAHAQVLLKNRIWVRRGVSITPHLIAHELAHVDQLNRLGQIGYWWTYARLGIRYGYDEHPMEVEAEAYAGTPAGIERAVRLLKRLGLV